MLDPATITDAIVTTLQTIPDLVTAMGGNSSNIFAYHYLLGTEHRLAEAVYKMKGPSIMVYWDGTQGGNFDGYTIWKHRFCVVIVAGNQANVASPASYEHIWRLVTSGPVNNTALNIRQINIIPQVDLMDTPSVSHMVNPEEQDYFMATFVIPEIGDNA